MNEYTASNGVRVKLEGNGAVYAIPPSMGVDHEVGWLHLANARYADTLREFFRAEEDERLGRWRWPENDDYVVYPEGAVVRVLCESRGTDEYPIHRHSGMDTPPKRAAAAYFDAHPEPKPWHNAKPGEVWLLTFTGFETDGSSPWTVRPGRLTTDSPEFLYPQNGNTLALRDPEITSGRRIWPESDHEQ